MSTGTSDFIEREPDAGAYVAGVVAVTVASRPCTTTLFHRAACSQVSDGEPYAPIHQRRLGPRHITFVVRIADDAAISFDLEVRDRMPLRSQRYEERTVRHSSRPHQRLAQ